jgi:glucan 1,3-beta-glucosidase
MWNYQFVLFPLCLSFSHETDLPSLSHRLGLENGWIPENPRTVLGSCESLVSENGFTIGYTTQPAPTLAPWMTGGAGAGTILDQAMYTSFSAWPPESIGVDYSTGTYKTAVSNLPTYTQTAPIITVPAPSQPTSFPSGYASSSIDVGSGWVQSTDTASFYTTASDCSYVDPWSGAGVASPTVPYCGGATAAATAAADASAATDVATDATDAEAVARRMRLAKRKSTPVAIFLPTPPPRPTRR